MKIRILAGIALFLLGSFVTLQLERAPITKDMVRDAKQLIGFDFTENQADSMLINLTNYRKAYDSIRKLRMPNNVVPALNFNPLPVGFVYPDSLSGFTASRLPDVVLPANEDELAFYSIKQLASLIRTRKISSVALIKFFLKRLHAYNGKLRNVITTTEAHALKQAAVADTEIAAGHYKGLLHGIPFGAKDLLAQMDYPTSFGAPIYKDRVLSLNATVINRLEQAGAILLAKTSMGELAMGDVWFGGKTRNPWDITRGSSGSSAGSASTVSMGCLPFAVGSETWGSIINPAAECGVTGLRPSFGRVSKYGSMALSWSMDKLGPITRNAEDAAIVFNVMQGRDPKDLSTIAAPFNYNGNVRSLKGYRIGYIKSDFDQKYDNHQNDSLTLTELRNLGAELVPIKYPNLPVDQMGFILTAEAGAAFQELVIDHRDNGLIRQERRNWPNILRSAQFISATDYINANRVRTLLIRQWYDTLKGLDLYMSPCFSTNLLLTNLTGNPAIVVPNGVLGKGQYRASITFMGQLFGEGKMLQAANVYQQATRFDEQHPVLMP